MMKMKRVLTVLLLAVMAFMLTACGGGTGDNKFTVTRVGTASLTSGVPYIEGTYNGGTYKVGVLNAFKDWTAVSVSLSATVGGDTTVTVSGGSGGDLTLDGGIDLTVQNADGDSRVIHVGKDDIFDGEKSGNTVVLILPAE